MGWLLQNTQVLAFVIIALFSVGSWVYRILQEQKAIKDTRDRERERQEEMLRTGRDPNDPSTSAGAGAGGNRSSLEAAAQGPVESDEQRLREVMQRRLAERQAQMAPRPSMPTSAGGSSSQGGQSGPVMKELWPGGPVVVVGQGGPGAGGPNAGGPVPIPAPVATRRAGTPTAPSMSPGEGTGRAERQRKVKRQRVEARGLSSGEGSSGQRSVPTTPKSGVKAVATASQSASRAYQKRTSLEQQRGRDLRADGATSGNAADTRSVRRDDAVPAGVPTTLEGWRAAFVASEVLGAPLALRD
jgi:hypothetical protein